MNGPREHLSTATLLDYWLHDSDAATTDRVDEHLLQCEACGQALDELVALGDGVRAAFRAGTVAAVSTDAFVQRLADQGLNLRSYQLPRNGSVNCTVAPEDDVVVSRLEVPLQGVQRLDAEAVLSTVPEQRHTLSDIPFDPRAGEVLYLPRLDVLRRLPAHTMQLTLLAVEPEGRRELGRYTFCHRPWPGH